MCELQISGLCDRKDETAALNLLDLFAGSSGSLQKRQSYEHQQREWGNGRFRWFDRRSFGGAQFPG
jgi:hypothetical protein